MHSRIKKLLLASTLLLLPVTIASAGELKAPEASPAVLSHPAEVKLKVSYKNGLTIGSADGSSEVKFGGRVFSDWAWFSAEDALPHSPNGTEIRAARIYLKGNLDENVFFKVNYDFASTKKMDGGPGFKDVYMGLKNVPVVQNVKVGHFWEPMGIETVTSSKYITFMERSLTSALTPARNSGIQALGTGADNRLTYAAGVFRDSDKFGKDTGSGHYAFTGRVTYVPSTNEDHTQMIHLGLSASHRKLNGVDASFALRPESHLAAKYIDFDVIPAESTNMVGLEWASVHGPFYTQAEYLMIDVDGESGGVSPSFSSYYAQASWFATGESKSYSASGASFGRVKPQNPWGSAGWGALELALRYSAADLRDEGLGDELTDITFGVNWYLTSHARVMANYVNSDLDSGGSSDAVMLRFQIDF